MDARKQWFYLAGLMLLGLACIVLVYVAEGFRHFWGMMVMGIR